MSATLRQWRVSTHEGVFETDLETLRQWITEGSVLPTDKVSKGNLSWIEAGRAPMLKNAFEGERTPPATPAPMAVAESTSYDIAEPEPGDDGFSRDDAELPVSQFQDPASFPLWCHNHPQVTPQHICPECGTVVCDSCIKFLRGVPSCPNCEGFCKPYAEVKGRVELVELQRSGFGFQDFLRALRYPLQHKVALACLALVYGVLLLAGLRGRMIAFVIVFGCMSHVINQVAWGGLNRSFMPDYSAFEFWDDLAVPIFLGLGITIVTWGPVILLILALFFGVLNAGPKVLALGAPPAESSQQTVSPADLAPLTDPNADPKQLEKANEKLDRLRPGSELAQEAEQSKKEASDPHPGLSLLLPMLGAGALLAMLLVIGTVWAIFYYPMALAVAGYTQSVGAVLNPLVGLDTIRRMGSTYFKAFGMVLLIQVISLFVGLVIATITAPLALPFVGNLPATFIDGGIAFYFNLVIACLLGLSLFKCGDRLGINVD
jgi:hypothetical protein